MLKFIGLARKRQLKKIIAAPMTGQKRKRPFKASSHVDFSREIVKDDMIVVYTDAKGVTTNPVYTLVRENSHCSSYRPREQRGHQSSSSESFPWETYGGSIVTYINAKLALSSLVRGRRGREYCPLLWASKAEARLSRSFTTALGDAIRMLPHASISSQTCYGESEWVRIYGLKKGREDRPGCMRDR